MTRRGTPAIIAARAVSARARERTATGAGAVAASGKRGKRRRPTGMGHMCTPLTSFFVIRFVSSGSGGSMCSYKAE